MDYSIYFMVFLGVYYTSLDFGELGAEGLMLTNDMFTEKGNDEYDGWHEVAGQADFDNF